MSFKIVRNDITKVAADAIVNTANPEPLYAEGTDAAIYHAAGEEDLLRVRKAIGAIARGDAKATPAFALQARYIIHTVGPVWNGGEQGEFEVLRSCYRKSLRLAEDLGCESIAFPLLSTGVYGFPKGKALEIATEEIRTFLEESEMDVTLVVFDEESFVLSGEVFRDIEALIGESEVREACTAEYGVPYAPVMRESLRARRGLFAERRKECSAPVFSQEAFDEDDLWEEDGPCFGAPPVEDQGESSKEDVCYGAPPVEGPCEEPSAAQEVHDDQKLSAPTWTDAMSAGKPEITEDLEDFINQTEETFQQKLFELIDDRGMDDVAVYKAANVSKKVFSTIKSRTDYHPNKNTAYGFCIALHLDMEETLDLLRRAAYTFSPSDKYDRIMEYFIRTGNYDMFTINEALFKYTGKCIGD